MPGLEGTILGRYRLVPRLGRGGMSEVYLAYDESMHREVAIKVVSGSHSDYLARFQREAEAIGRLHHDHILPAYDYGEQGPWHYLVMPYIGTRRIIASSRAPNCSSRSSQNSSIHLSQRTREAEERCT